MSASAMSTFMNYFHHFEAALTSGDWEAVRESLAKDARYRVEGVPFACDIRGRDEIVEALKKSTAAFDASMDFRMLEIQSIFRLGPNRIRVDLLSGYGREATGAATAPVAIEVTAVDGAIVELRDIYDPELTAPALTFLAMNLSDADPSYV